jgi:5'-nucleotidase
MEGLLEGISSIAFSLTSFVSQEFTTAANFACKLVTQVAKEEPICPIFLNVNVPPVPENEIAGVKITRQGLRRYIENFEKRVDPRGKSYYWLAGEIVEDLEQPEHLHISPDIPTDVQAIRENYITITPLQYNLTDIYAIDVLKNTNWNPTVNTSIG